MKLYNIKKLYQGFKDATGIEDELLAKSLWDNLITYKSDADNFSELFEDWMVNSEIAKKYIN